MRPSCAKRSRRSRKRASSSRRPRIPSTPASASRTSAATAAGISVALTAPGASCRRSSSATPRASKYRYARRAGEAQSYLIDRNPDVPRAAAQWVDSVVVDVRGERVREVTITHADGEVVRLSKASPELANFEVADVPKAASSRIPASPTSSCNAARAQSRGRRARGGAGREPDDRRVSNVRRSRRASHRHRARRPAGSRSRRASTRQPSGRRAPPAALPRRGRRDAAGARERPERRS